MIIRYLRNLYTASHMKILLSFFLFSVFCSFSMALEHEGFQVDEKVVYKTVGEGADQVSLPLHFFYPEGHKKTEARPAIIFFFGGGWKGGSPSQFYPHCAYFAQRGMVTVSAEYRVESRHKTTPQECVKDGKSAVRWLKKNAEKYGIDPEKVIAGGGSAGGHVAAATGTVKGFNEEGEDLTTSSVPAALILFNPVYDNSEQGYGYNRVKEYWEAFSPAHNISKQTPPTVSFFGDKDRHHTPEVARAFHEKLEAQGVKNTFFLYPGEGHGFFNLGRAGFKPTLIEADKFLGQLGYLNGTPDEALLDQLLSQKKAERLRAAEKKAQQKKEATEKIETH